MMGEKMTEVVRSTAINLNILRIQNKNACNMRSFEIPGAGGFLLQEQSSEYERLFRPGEHFDSFRSVSELREKIRYYLENPGARERIAANGFALAQNYTYDAWARRMLDVV
ncbi:MAG: glycosyltransferase [Myxococcota bacterium]